jgi:hypothetical protein
LLKRLADILIKILTVEIIWNIYPMIDLKINWRKRMLLKNSTIFTITLSILMSSGGFAGSHDESGGAEESDFTSLKMKKKKEKGELKNAKKASKESQKKLGKEPKKKKTLKTTKIPIAEFNLTLTPEAQKKIDSFLQSREAAGDHEEDLNFFLGSVARTSSFSEADVEDISQFLMKLYPKITVTFTRNKEPKSGPLHTTLYWSWEVKYKR